MSTHVGSGSGRSGGRAATIYRTLVAAASCVLVSGAAFAGLTAAATGAQAVPAICAKADVVVVAHSVDLTSATVRLAATRPDGATGCAVSLHAYQTQGPTWASSGQQAQTGVQTVMLTVTNGSHTLTVAMPQCFAQIDLVVGSQLFDGTAAGGPLPHFPLSHPFVDTQLRSFSGGAGCSSNGTSIGTTAGTVTNPTPRHGTPVAVSG